MCGIAGAYSFNSNVPKDIIVEMCNQIVHRGPDSDGYFVNSNVALGMRRLRVIDLNTGDQPIYNEDKSICIVFNGEIYNFKDLKKELLNKGHKFYTLSDTEVVIHLYEEFGEKCIEKLRGMFAFAIWDNGKKKLFICRDRLGIKPIYYLVNSEYFLFASEIKSILTFPGIEKELDITALNDYFSFLYIPAPQTIFKNIYKLLPGHSILIEKGEIKFNQYWDHKLGKTKIRSLNEGIEEFLRLFSESVKLRMISDVPLGAFLSGGVDSSLVVATMSKYSEKPIETFSIGYDSNGSAFDERKYAKIVSKKFGTNHHEFELNPSEIIEIFEKTIWQFDEPFADASAIPNYLISEKTKNYVTVALSGLGGDELCAGYVRYNGCLFAEKYNKLPKLIKDKLIPSFAGLLPDSKSGKHLNERIKRFINSADLTFLRRYFNIVATFNTDEKVQLFCPDIKREVKKNSEDIFTRYDINFGEEINLIDRMLHIDLKTYLVDDLLTLTDRMSMAHALEVRVPFLDHNLVEFFASVVPELKIRKLKRKYLLNKVAEKILPKEIIYRRKMGFSVPLVLWFRKELKEYVGDILNENRIKEIGFFNYSFISDILKEHLLGKRNYDEKIWSLICFVKWYEKYLLGF